MNISLKEIYNREAFENLFDINVKKFSKITLNNNYFIKPNDINYDYFKSRTDILKDLINSNKNAEIYIFPENEVENAVNSLENNPDYLEYNFDKFKKIDNINDISNLNNQIIKVSIKNIPENLKDEQIFFNADFKVDISQDLYSISSKGNISLDFSNDKINKFNCNTSKIIGKDYKEENICLDNRSLNDFSNLIKIFIDQNIQIDFSKNTEMDLHLDIKNNFYNSSLDFSGKFNSDSSELFLKKLNIETKDIETNENFSKKLENLNIFDESSGIIVDNLIDNFSMLNSYESNISYYFG